MVTSIKRSIYTHVNELIAQNEERPEQLARIYHNLQNMNSSEIMANLNNVESSNNRRSRPWGPSMYRDVEDEEEEEDVEDEDDDDEEENNANSLFKNTTGLLKCLFCVADKK